MAEQRTTLGVPNGPASSPTSPKASSSSFTPTSQTGIFTKKHVDIVRRNVNEYSQGPSTLSEKSSAVPQGQILSPGKVLSPSDSSKE